MAVGEVYAVIDEYTWEGGGALGSNEACQNRYFYRHAAGSTAQAAAAMLTAFYTGVFPALKALAPTWINWRRLTIYNYMDATDFFTDAYVAQDGTRVPALAEPVTPEMNIRFFADRPFPGTRQASKQYPFLGVSDIEGKNVSPTLVASAEAVAVETALGINITSGGNTFTPAVFRPTGAIGAGGTVIWTPAPWDIDPRLSSQYKRKG